MRISPATSWRSASTACRPTITCIWRTVTATLRPTASARSRESTSIPSIWSRSIKDRSARGGADRLGSAVVLVPDRRVREAVFRGGRRSPACDRFGNRWSPGEGQRRTGGDIGRVSREQPRILPKMILEIRDTVLIQRMVGDGLHPLIAACRLEGLEKPNQSPGIETSRRTGVGALEVRRSFDCTREARRVDAVSDAFQILADRAAIGA